VVTTHELRKIFDESLSPIDMHVMNYVAEQDEIKWCKIAGGEVSHGSAWIDLTTVSEGRPEPLACIWQGID
jgi:hypothetical protein